jgi:hypothetical protein
MAGVRGGVCLAVLLGLLSACGSSSGGGDSPGDAGPGSPKPDSSGGGDAQQGHADGGQPEASSDADAGHAPDVGTKDAGSPDSGANDSGALDAGGHDGGASDARAPDASGSGDSGWVDNVPSGMPQVVSYGGPVIKNPVLQSITFPGYDMVSQMDDFVAQIGSTAFWEAAVGEYGVGAPTAQKPVHLLSAAPTSIDDSEIQTWLAQQITGGTSGLMAPSANAIYVISYPATTTVTLQGATSCTTFGGYHNSVAVGATEVAYAVVPECTFMNMTTLDTITASASHELIEAVTDPHPLTTTPTYASIDQNHLYMQVLLGGGEIGDLCAQWQSSFFMPSGFTYTVQRPWSNAAAKAGRDPCQPEPPGEVFFNSVPLLTDTVSIAYQNQTFSTLGASIGVGASKTVPVQLYSEGPIGPWKVNAVALNSQGITNDLTFVWDKTSGQNGDTLHLTITVATIDPTVGGDFFLIESTIGSTTNAWVGYVSN